MSTIVNLLFPPMFENIPDTIAIDGWFQDRTITIPVATHGTLSFNPVKHLPASINLDEIGIIFGDPGHRLGPDIVQPLTGQYTLRQMVTGLNIPVIGSGVAGMAVATIRLHDILYYDADVILKAHLTIGAALRGKAGYRRTRFS